MGATVTPCTPQVGENPKVATGASGGSWAAIWGQAMSSPLPTAPAHWAKKAALQAAYSA